MFFSDGKIADLASSPKTSEVPLHVLVAKCSQSQDGDQWQSLVERLQPVFARTIYRLAASTSGGAQLNEVDDLVQDSFLKLKGRMDGFIRPTAFENEAAAVAYFKVLAANTAKDYFRSRSAGKRSDSATTSLDDRLEELISGESASLVRHVLFTQIDRALDCDSVARTIFWLYYRQGLTVSEIAGIPLFQLKAKGVESLIRRLTLAVKEKINPQKPEGEAGGKAFS